MAYQKHTWVNKEIIKADQLNHIEDGIYNEEQRAKVAEELLGERIDEIVVEAGAYKVTLDHIQELHPSSKYIYLEPDPQATGSDKFREWVYVYNETTETYVWKMIGDVSLDLSNYVQKTDYASSNAFGIIKVDGSTITANNGVISATAQATGVTSFNGRTGDVSPQSGDYTASDVGLGNVGNFKAVSTNANQGLSSLEQANARANISAGTSNFSGSYNDLSNKPTIPSKTSDLTNDSGYITSSSLPTVNNATLTIQKNGTNVQTFTANQATNATANITVPTNVSELNNDSGYTTNIGTVTQVKVGDTAYNPTSGIISLPDYPSTPTVNNSTITMQLNGSDVDSFTTNQASPKTINIEVTKSSVGLNNVGNFKAVSTAANQGLSDTEKANARTNIGAGSSTFSGDYNDLTNKPTLGTAAAKDVPTSGNASTSQVVMGNDSRLSDSRTPTSHNQASNTINAMTGYSKASSAAAIATTDSLNTAIGKLEKTLDGKGTSNLTIGTTSTTAAAGNHTHTLTIATDSGTNQITLAANTKYKITAGGSTYIFTTPPDNNTRDFKKGTSRSGATADVLYFVYTT